MALKKLEHAAKKAAKKATKKAAKKGSRHEKDSHDHKDIRRAFEHLGRLEVLQGSLSSGAISQIQTLSDLARLSLLQGQNKSSADLLRACEHLAFGSLAANRKETVNEVLMSAIREQYEKLLERAADHWDENEEEPGEPIVSIYESSLAAAETAFGKGAYRKALEFVRAAEALSAIRLDPSNMLDDDLVEFPLNKGKNKLKR
jgi:hypothetical protein